MPAELPPLRTADHIRDCSPLVRLTWSSVHFFCRTYQQVDVLNPCPLPPSGPSILVCNHISGLDPLLLQSSTKRVVVWMMAREMYEIRRLQPAFQMIDAIPLTRGARDASALRLAIRALQAGRVLGIFPEGRIAPATEPGLLPFQSGVASLALRVGATIVPAYINGTNRGRDVFPSLQHSNRVRIRFGQPIPTQAAKATNSALDELGAVVHDAVEALRQAELAEFGRILGLNSL